MISICRSFELLSLDDSHLDCVPLAEYWPSTLKCQMNGGVKINGEGRKFYVENKNRLFESTKLKYIEKLAMIP